MIHEKSLDWNGWKQDPAPVFPSAPMAQLSEIQSLFLPCSFTVLKIPPGNYTDSWVDQEQLLYEESHWAFCQLY